MKKHLAMATTVLLTASLATAPAWAKKEYKKVKGQVVKVEQHVRTANGGESDRLTIRTRQGQQLHLNLGEGGACEGCYQAGDQIRARVRAEDGSGGPQGVQSMQVRRGGQRFSYANVNGKMVGTSNGGQGTGQGDRIRDRDRTNDPDCTGCVGEGPGRRASGGRQASGGRSRGGN